MTRRVCPRARAAARASAERLHRAIGTSEGMPLAPMTPRQRVPAVPRDAAARMRDALHMLERHGLAMPSGPAWKLTPRGWERYADGLAAASGRRAPG